MPELKIIRIRFKGPFHFSDGREDYSKSKRFFRSDKMYAALIQVLSEQYGKDMSGAIDGLYLSSLFPFYNKEGTYDYFFPKPKIPLRLPENSPFRPKDVKKIKWLGKEYFEKLLNGENLFEKLDDGLMEAVEHAKKNGGYLSSIKIENPFFKSMVQSRVMVPREEGNDSLPYVFENVFMDENAGFYFIYQADEHTEIYLTEALEILKDEGLGSDKAYGFGMFEYEKDKFTLEIPESDYITNLSVFIPGDGFELNEKTVRYYELIKRGGYISTFPYNTFRKKSVYAFSEGSVFYLHANEMLSMGKRLSLKPVGVEVDWEIWRNGKSLFLPVKIKD